MPTVPEKYGPGTWFCLHLLAYHSNARAQIAHFIVFIKMLIANFWCEECQKHFSQYLEEHPIQEAEPYRTREGLDLTVFRWSWAFHNAVNRRLHKPEADWDKVLAVYSQHKHIDDDCSDCRPTDYPPPRPGRIETNPLLGKPNGQLVKKSLGKNILQHLKI